MAASAMNAHELVTSLISSISTTTTTDSAGTTANPLKDFDAERKNILLSLYVLFEKELLPALDLLDRNLISRLKIKDNSAATFYLVRSAQHYGHRNANYEHVNYYEVRLKAWSCSCPAFTFSAFPASSGPHDESMANVANKQRSAQPWRFGGLTRGSNLAVCKHLLACVLTEYSDAFAHLAEEREVSREELAGWAAGWGD